MVSEKEQLALDRLKVEEEGKKNPKHHTTEGINREFVENMSYLPNTVIEMLWNDLHKKLPVTNKGKRADSWHGRIQSLSQDIGYTTGLYAPDVKQDIYTVALTNLMREHIKFREKDINLGLAIEAKATKDGLRLASIGHTRSAVYWAVLTVQATAYAETRHLNIQGSFDDDDIETQLSLTKGLLALREDDNSDMPDIPDYVQTDIALEVLPNLVRNKEQREFLSNVLQYDEDYVMTTGGYEQKEFNRKVRVGADRILANRKKKNNDDKIKAHVIEALEGDTHAEE